MHRWIAVALVIVLVSALATLSYESAYAATITVTTTADELNADGDCSLREAIRAANLDQAVDACPAGSGTDTITLGAQTYTLQRAADTTDDDAQTGDLDLAGPLTLIGVKGSTTIVASNLFDRVVHVLPGATVQISGVVLTGGYVDMAVGGGILNEGTLTLTDSALRQNSATQGDGGGIYNTNRGILTLLRTEVSGNDAGPRASGAGIVNDGSLTITASLIRDNHGDYATAGGGIANRGTLTMTTTTVSGNSADSSNLGNTAGGGILNSGTATISASTISGNSTSGGGRGAGIYTRGEILLINTTIHGNTTGAGVEEGSVGGGIANEGGKVRGSNNTITGNTVAGNSDAPGQGAGIYTAAGSSTKLWNTILAGNTGVGTATSDCVGPLTSNGYNLIQNASGCTITGETTNILGVDPKLGPLQNNGGLTLTRMVLSGSPALDAAHPALPGADPNACYYTDQRDLTRPQDGNGDGVARCDIGAVERVGVAPTVTATPTATRTATATTTPTRTSVSPSQTAQPTQTPTPTQTSTTIVRRAYLSLVYGYDPTP